MDRPSIFDISPTEFEKYCLDILSGFAEEEKLKDFEITHNKIIKVHDGSYQIDVYAEFTALGTNVKVLCECKRYRQSISREKVAALHQKLESIGAQKGILISTSNFQRGAIEYGKIHGIALIKVSNYHFEHLSHSSGPSINEENDPFLYAENHLPPFEAFDYTVFTDEGEPLKVYPTHAFISELNTRQYNLIKEFMKYTDI